MGLRNRLQLTDYSCFFITTTCHKWLNLLIYDECIQLLYDSLLFVNKKHNGHIVGYVFMFNHIHLIVYFPQENKLSDYMRDFKKYTSALIRKIVEKQEGKEQIEKLKYSYGNQKYKVWMDRFDDVVIKSTRVLLTKLNYIHYNPVKKDLVNYPEEYEHSSAGFYFQKKTPKITLLHYSEII